MRRNKTQKGITLVALIITIVVLLILAAVAIAAIQNNRIMEQAQSGADEYGEASEKEQITLALNEWTLKKHTQPGTTFAEFLGQNVEGSSVVDNEDGTFTITTEKGNQYIVSEDGTITNGGTGSGSETMGDAAVGTPVDRISTINGQQYSANNPVIPAGFKAINSGANWDATDLAAEVKKGLVISDGTSEFVWIPVPTISEMAKVTSGTDANRRTNYEGKLYDFSKESDGTLTATEKTGYGQSTNSNASPSYREPGNLTDDSFEDNANRFTLSSIKSAWDADYYQKSFNKMVESVAEYKGFYVGRYEMSINATSGKAQSKAGETSVYNDSDANIWWGLYEKATTYSTSGVISEMIWGCQYDAIMRWMQGNNIDVTSTTPTDTNRNTAASYNTTRITGSADSNDILNNIYDILGNSMEWTQEAYHDYHRVPRGGYDNWNLSPETRNFSSDVHPAATYGNLSSRLTLYVEM